MERFRRTPFQIFRFGLQFFTLYLYQTRYARNSNNIMRLKEGSQKELLDFKIIVLLWETFKVQNIARVITDPGYLGFLMAPAWSNKETLCVHHHIITTDLPD